METNQQKEGQSEVSSQVNPPSESQQTSTTNPTEGNSDVLKALAKIDTGVETIRENTSSKENTDALNKIDKGVEQLLDIVRILAPPKEETQETTPKTPDVHVDGPKFLAIRKRGGRVIRRVVKEEDKK